MWIYDQNEDKVPINVKVIQTVTTTLTICRKWKVQLMKQHLLLPVKVGLTGLRGTLNCMILK